MEEKLDRLKADMAWVTPYGILWNYRNYSCKRAVRDGWFELSHIRSPWMVRILYDPSAGPEGAVYIESDEFEPENVCFAVKNETDPAKAAAYQRKLRQLQQERKQLALDTGDTP